MSHLWSSPKTTTRQQRLAVDGYVSLLKYGYYVPIADKEGARLATIQGCYATRICRSQNEHWDIVPHSIIPKATPILSAVWSMKIKRYITMREQRYDLHYDETYSCVVLWAIMHFFLIDHFKYAILLIKNVPGQKQASQVCYQCLVQGLRFN